jgi:hypothetical protein
MQKEKIVKTAIKSDNKNVVCFDGSIHPREECRKIENQYYKLGDPKVKNSGQCYLIKWGSSENLVVVRANNSQLIFDELNQIYCRLDDNISYGYFNEKQKGYFRKQEGGGKLYEGNSGKMEVAINKEVLNANCYFDSLRNIWREGKVSPEEWISHLRNTRETKPLYLTFNPNCYNFSDIDASLKNAVQNAHNDYLNKIPDNAFDAMFAKRTWGIEAETSSGCIPEDECFNLGVFPLRDGSITGHEFVTSVISKKPVGIIDQLFTLLSKYTITNDRCSLHIHVGNLPKSKKFTVALYHLYCRLQDEIDEVNVPFKRDSTFLATKRDGKDHCKRMPILNPRKETINEMFNYIMTLFNDGVFIKDFDSDAKLFRHQMHGRPKWDAIGRYHAINFIPFYFDAKQTVEFRVPAATCNKYKALFWMFLFNAIVEYAEQNADYILENKDKIFLEDVINKVYGNVQSRENAFIVNWLLQMISDRKNYNRTLILSRELFGNHFSRDNTYKVEYTKASPFHYYI